MVQGRENNKNNVKDSNVEAFWILALEPKDAKFGWVASLHACGQRFC